MINFAFDLKQNIYSRMIVKFQTGPQMNTLSEILHGYISMIPTLEIGNISNDLDFCALRLFLNSCFSNLHSNIYTAFVIHSKFANCQAAMCALNNN